MKRILLPVRTVADWGGIHEWTIDAAKALSDAGHSVAFIGGGEIFEARAKEISNVDFYTLDWGHWREHINPLAERFPTADLIFAHGPEARALGLELKRKIDVELHVMIHGAYHDFMHTWSNQVDSFLAASPSLVHFVQRFGRVEPWKVTNIPNAVADSVFDLAYTPFQEKISDGSGRIVTASRLSSDKVEQIPVVMKTVDYLAKRYPEVSWSIDVYGDGPLRDQFESRYRAAEASHQNVQLNMGGWISPEAVPSILNNSVACVSAGMAAVRAIGSGTLCIGVGARNYVGPQFGTNLRAGIWSNFGDHGLVKFRPRPLEEDLELIFEDNNYDCLVETSRTALRRTHMQSLVDERMLSALQC